MPLIDFSVYVIKSSLQYTYLSFIYLLKILFVQMEYPFDVTIKEEKDVFEDKNDNYLQLFNVKVKIENEITFEDDWSIQVFDKYHETISYEVLKRQCLQTCLVCYKLFSDSFSILQHNLTHLKVPLIQHKVFMCDSCPAFYKYKNDLQSHISLLHPTKQYTSTLKLHLKCEICMTKFPFRQWVSHRKKVHNNVELKCKKCNKIFKDSSYLKRHILFVHKGVRPSWRYHHIKTEQVKCPKCPAIFTNKFSLPVHLRNCHSDRVYECEVCKSKLKSKPYLQTHMKRVHYNDGIIYNCEICNKTFRSLRYLQVHKRNVHVPKCKKKS